MTISMSSSTPKLPDLSNTAYWAAIKQWALDTDSDGCTWAKDIFLPSCWEHDYHCVHHKTWFGEPLSSVQAAERFRDVIRMLSPLHKLSIVSRVRYFVVRYFGPQWD